MRAGLAVNTVQRQPGTAVQPLAADDPQLRGRICNIVDEWKRKFFRICDQPNFVRFLNLSDVLAAHNILIPGGHHVPNRLCRIPAVWQAGNAYRFSVPADFVFLTIVVCFAHAFITAPNNRTLYQIAKSTDTAIAMACSFFSRFIFPVTP